MTRILGTRSAAAIATVLLRRQQRVRQQLMSREMMRQSIQSFSRFVEWPNLPQRPPVLSNGRRPHRGALF
jgi:hypothetical protein